MVAVPLNELLAKYASHAPYAPDDSDDAETPTSVADDPATVPAVQAPPPWPLAAHTTTNAFADVVIVPVTNAELFGARVPNFDVLVVPFRPL